MLMNVLTRGITSHNPFVRKGSALVLKAPRWVRGKLARAQEYRTAPPVLANSFPKSGTHLLAQVVAGLPRRVNYGAWLGSMISSFQFRERTAANVQRFIAGIVPGEIVRGHLFYDAQYVDDLDRQNVVHYFIYRDPRDVIVSEAHYAREMNRWHRLHPYFRRLASLEEAITLSINGFDPPKPGIHYPNIAERFARYEGWLSHERCLSIKFEDMRSEELSKVIREMARFYASRTQEAFDVDAFAIDMESRIAPKQSHTFRSGKKGGWREKFTPEHRRRFAELTGDLLVRLGYEENDAWIDEPAASMAH
jgi:hypothetical protein